jgi:hypothetical protein
LNKEEKRKFKNELDRINTMLKTDQSKETIRRFVDNEARFVNKNISSNLFEKGDLVGKGWRAHILDLSSMDGSDFIYK